MRASNTMLVQMRWRRVPLDRLAKRLYVICSRSRSWFQIAWLSAIKSLVGFGYMPELGFIWIFAIVFMASIYFWLGRQEVTSEYKPDNWFIWFLFSLNAVLP